MRLQRPQSHSCISAPGLVVRVATDNSEDMLGKGVASHLFISSKLRAKADPCYHRPPPPTRQNLATSRSSPRLTRSLTTSAHPIQPNLIHSDLTPPNPNQPDLMQPLPTQPTQIKPAQSNYTVAKKDPQQRRSPNPSGSNP